MHIITGHQVTVHTYKPLQGGQYTYVHMYLDSVTRLLGGDMLPSTQSPIMKSKRVMPKLVSQVEGQPPSHTRPACVSMCCCMGSLSSPKHMGSWPQVGADKGDSRVGGCLGGEPHRPGRQTVYLCRGRGSKLTIPNSRHDGTPQPQ